MAEELYPIERMITGDTGYMTPDHEEQVEHSQAQQVLEQQHLQQKQQQRLQGASDETQLMLANIGRGDVPMTPAEEEEYERAFFAPEVRQAALEDRPKPPQNVEDARMALIRAIGRGAAHEAQQVIMEMPSAVRDVLRDVPWLFTTGGDILHRGARALIEGHDSDGMRQRMLENRRKEAEQGQGESLRALKDDEATITRTKQAQGRAERAELRNDPEPDPEALPSSLRGGMTIDSWRQLTRATDMGATARMREYVLHRYHDEYNSLLARIQHSQPRRRVLSKAEMIQIVQNPGIFR